MKRTGIVLFTTLALAATGAIAHRMVNARASTPYSSTDVLSPDSDGLLCPPSVSLRPPPAVPPPLHRPSRRADGRTVCSALATYRPTVLPSYRLTVLPSYRPTVLPSYRPTVLPSYRPTVLPSYRPPAFFLSVRPHMEHTERHAPVLKVSGRQAQQTFVPRRLSAFSRAKAEGYLRDRYPCLGCHRLNGEGGQIGPDLTDVGRRRAPSYIYEMIRDPQTTRPGTVMPRQLMPRDRIELLASYLVGEGQSGAVPGSPSVADRELPEPLPDLTSGAGLYGRYCASCHGTSGNADGYNSGFLPVAPTNHADSSAMSLRPDDTLFDGIHAGGYILGKSHRMPAFGQMFSSAQIRSLVAHIRQLCGCEQPEWARQ